MTESQAVSAKNCRVTFKDLGGISHSVEVTADSVYEAAVLGLKALKRSEWVETIGPGTRLAIQVLEPPVEHFLYYAQLMTWLDGGATNPADVVKKKKLKLLLTG